MYKIKKRYEKNLTSYVCFTKAVKGIGKRLKLIDATQAQLNILGEMKHEFVEKV